MKIMVKFKTGDTETFTPVKLVTATADTLFIVVENHYKLVQRTLLLSSIENISIKLDSFSMDEQSLINLCHKHQLGSGTCGDCHNESQCLSFTMKYGKPPISYRTKEIDE